LSLRLVSRRNYGIALEIAVNVFWRTPPKVAKAPMMATAMRAAIRAYSMAVTPDSSFAKRAVNVMSDVLV
jgi:hypothetical protein